MNADLRTFHDLDDDGYDVKGYMDDERPGMAESFTELGGKLLMPFCFCIVFWLSLVGALYIGGVLG